MTLDRCNEKSGRAYLTPAEIEVLIAASGKGRHGARDRAMAHLLYYHAYRATELCNIRLVDIDAETSHIHVHRLKGSTSGIQRLNLATLRACKRWLALRPDSAHPNLFISERRMPFTRKGVAYLVQTWGERASLPFHVHPHMLRHSCGYALVNLADGTRDLRQIQDWLGHKSPTHTAHYTALAPGRFKGLWGDG